MYFYEKVTLEVVKELKDKKELSSDKIAFIWKEVCRRLEGTESLIKKGCPRLTFIGLCEKGFIEGITVTGKFKNSLNKNYGVAAAKLLKDNKGVNYNTKQLWKEIGNDDKRHNSQMNVVLALWNNNIII